MLQKMQMYFQMLWFTLLGCHETSRQIFKELKVTHLIWHLIHLVSLSLMNCFPIYEVCISCSPSKSPKKYGPPPFPITHPTFLSVLHVNLICNVDWSHHRIVHMNDIETTKCHFHSLLLNFTVDFLLHGIPLGIFSHSWNKFALYFFNKYYMQAHIYMLHHPSSPKRLSILSLRPVVLALYFLLNSFLQNTSSMCPSHTMQQLLFCIFRFE